MKRTLLVLLVMLFAGSLLHAQSVTVRGRVTSSIDGFPISGASVQVDGATAIGTSTDSTGRYELKANKGQTLRFSAVGMIPATKVIGDTLEIDVVLQASNQDLGEVVVTALGIERNKKNLTYAVQTVKGDDLRSANQGNLINSLQGQVAGAQISSSGGSPGLPSEIILRGSTTLSGDNQPLMIVDGIRINNTANNLTVNRAADINPDDIEDITILKGAAAAALYGIDAASGAIIINTKKGKAGTIKISGSYKTFMETMGRLPRQQGIYTTGTGGIYDEASGSSWGRKFRYDEAIYDNLERFFETGVTHDVNMNVTGGTDKLQYYVSGGYRKGNAMIPNTEQEKINLLMKATAKLSQKVSLTVSTNYIKNDIQEGLAGASAGGWINSILTYPRRYDIRAYQKPNGEPWYAYKEEEDDGRNARISPMWGAMRNPRNNNVDRFIVNANLDYKPFNWMTLSYRLGQDYTAAQFKSVITPGTPSADYFRGFLSESNSKSKFITSIFNATMQKKFWSDFNTSLILGASSDYFELHSISYTAENFLVPDIPSVNNSEKVITREALPRRQRYSYYGDFGITYKNLFSLNVTGRVDRSSTLPQNTRTFYSDSYSGSFTFSELFDTRRWTGKVRASYARVGKDAPIYRTNSNQIQYLGYGGGYVVDATGGNPALGPERTKELEIGTELSFWQRRLNVDVAYYDRRTTSMIMTPRVPLPSGYVIMTFNAGSLWNRGVEASVNVIPVKTKDFTWSATVNAWKNTSKMLEFAGDIVTFKYTNAQLNGGSAATTLGDPVLGIVGTDYKRTPEGYVIVDANGYPIIDGIERNIGNREPKFNMGFLNRLTYKSFSLAFLWDFRFGGDILNASRQRMMSVGTAYDIGAWRDKEFVFNGVVAQQDGSYARNTKPVVLDYTYFAGNYYQVGTNFVETINWSRLRFVTLGYSLPKAWASRIGLANVGIEFSAQNPFVITNYSGGDPEVNSAGPNAGGTGASSMGVDNGAIPLPRSFSFGINISL